MHDQLIKALYDAQETIDALAQDSHEAGYTYRAERAEEQAATIRELIQKARHELP